MQSAERLVVLALQLLTLLLQLSSSGVQVGLLLSALLGPFGLQLVQRVFLNPLVFGNLFLFAALLRFPGVTLIAEVFDLAVQLPRIFFAEPLLFLLDLLLHGFEDDLLLAL